ncbi:asparagine synthetase domain-containing protein 1 [Ipomoea triloba]|uniref:asparagine synthetase domain-containing protein 1 n=1 Tax=Ipomoea triloba TaxID=35885 RepID=UPI00125E061B|nr:asparagine synthetase domain-containing protein 1 [Ipomoea triloba]
MCGIALIVSGIRIDLSSLLPDFISPTPQFHQQALFLEEDIKTVLRRRGPDSLGSKTVFLHFKTSPFGEGKCEIVAINDNENCSKKTDIKLSNGSAKELFGELRFIGATLQLRGVNPIVQPLVDECGNILVYNGEIFGGICVASYGNDTEVLMQSLRECCCCISSGHNRSHFSDGQLQSSIPELLSRIKGPWAMIYWQNSSKTLWFGRDAFGRRSLLVHWPTKEDSRFLLSSVSPPSSTCESSGFSDCEQSYSVDFWEELPCGVYNLSIGAYQTNRDLVGDIRKHDWPDPKLKELIRWERTCVQPTPEELHSSRIEVSCEQDNIRSNSVSGRIQCSSTLPLQKVMNALRESVMKRTSNDTVYQAVSLGCDHKNYAPVALLFSGGLDSMILAALMDQCMDAEYEIDLLNVSFDGQCAPDRISARAGLKELQRIAPSRRWKLVEIDADLQKLTSETKHVMSLINPAKTYMDLNIGIALWLAAGGDGWVYQNTSASNGERFECIKYKSDARVLLVGSGADEQCAGYGRHRTKFRNGSWLGLSEEMKLDMQRIWKRNLGRDDRCIADNGKEARFPFLDEDVIRTLLDIPLWEIADLNQPSGVGDKKILREIAQLLGLSEAASLPKRAIQFGSRIARESNRKNFGSNRAANQASAGSVVIYGPSN